jgi:hypothetical protein
MSFTLNTIFQLKAELVGLEHLTLNVIFDVYDTLSNRLGYEATLSQLSAELQYLFGNLNSTFPIVQKESTDSNSIIDSGYESDSSSDIEWVSSDPSNPIQSIEVHIEEDFPEYRNDIYLHKGFHRCRHECEGAVFLCGNSFINFQNDVTKCGYIARSYSMVAHECPGSRDLYFENKDSRSYHPYTKSKSNRRSKSNNNKAFSKYSP